METKLPEQCCVLGEDFSVADAYLLVMYIWRSSARMGGTMPERLKWKTRAQRVCERPAVHKIIEIEPRSWPDIELGPESFEFSDLKN